MVKNSVQTRLTQVNKHAGSPNIAFRRMHKAWGVPLTLNARVYGQFNITFPDCPDSIAVNPFSKSSTAN